MQERKPQRSMQERSPSGTYTYRALLLHHHHLLYSHRLGWNRVEYMYVKRTDKYNATL